MDFPISIEKLKLKSWIMKGHFFSEYDKLINPGFHQTIQTSVVNKVHVCFKVFSDLVSSLDFVQIDSSSTTQEL